MSTWLSRTTLFTAFIAPTLLAANLDLTPMHRSLQFNFSYPGARALGMGGAFLGAADDASAAESNPAGLTALRKRELTLEFRRLDFGEDVQSGLLGTSSAGVQRVADKKTVPSFLSIVVPAGSTTFAVYYARPLDYELKATVNDPAGLLGPVGTQQYFFGDVPGVFALHYQAETIGASAAWKFGNLSLGAGAQREKFKATSTFGLFDHPSPGLPVKLSNTLVNFGRIEGSDSKIAYSAGLKWQATDNFSIGAVYKSGADYTIAECNPSSATATCSSTASSGPSAFSIPPQYGAGISFHPVQNAMINADVVHVQYDRLVRHFEPAEFCAIGACQQGAGLGFEIKNANEIHVGGEWSFVPSNIPLAIRAGWWHDPDHTLHYRGATNSSDPFERLAQQYSALRYPGGDSQDHVAVGLGYITPGFEINAAYDHSSLSKTASISALRRF